MTPFLRSPSKGCDTVRLWSDTILSPSVSVLYLPKFLDLPPMYLHHHLFCSIRQCDCALWECTRRHRAFPSLLLSSLLLLSMPVPHIPPLSARWLSVSARPAFNVCLHFHSFTPSARVGGLVHSLPTVHAFCTRVGFVYTITVFSFIKTYFTSWILLYVIVNLCNFNSVEKLIEKECLISRSKGWIHWFLIVIRF